MKSEREQETFQLKDLFFKTCKTFSRTFMHFFKRSPQLYVVLVVKNLWCLFLPHCVVPPHVRGRGNNTRKKEGQITMLMILCRFWSSFRCCIRCCIRSSFSLLFSCFTCLLPFVVCSVLLLLFSLRRVSLLRLILVCLQVYLLLVPLKVFLTTTVSIVIVCWECLLPKNSPPSLVSFEELPSKNPKTQTLCLQLESRFCLWLSLIQSTALSRPSSSFNQNQESVFSCISTPGDSRPLQKIYLKKIICSSSSLSTFALDVFLCSWFLLQQNRGRGGCLSYDTRRDTTDKKEARRHGEATDCPWQRIYWFNFQALK